MIAKIALATAAMMGGQCGAPADPPPVRPAQHIYIPEDYDVEFDARAANTITLIMYPDGDPVQRCLDAGGEPIYNPYTLIWTCDNVDF